jgi:hypothetical protein
LHPPSPERLPERRQVEIAVVAGPNSHRTVPLRRSTCPLSVGLHGGKT